MLQQAGGFPAANTRTPLWFRKGGHMKKLVAIALILSLGMFSVIGCGTPKKDEPKKGGAAAPANPGGEKTPDTKPPAK
jgi:hypothetical protein